MTKTRWPEELCPAWRSTSPTWLCSGPRKNSMSFLIGAIPSSASAVYRRYIGMGCAEPSTLFEAMPSFIRNVNGSATWSRRFRPTPGRSTIVATPAASSSSAGPTPERRSRCGEPIAPPHRITSVRARRTVPSVSSTPTARGVSRSSSKRTRRTSELPRMTRFGRPRAWARKVSAELCRTRFTLFSASDPTPPAVPGSLTSAQLSNPAATQASCQATSAARHSERRWRRTGTGPRSPWKSSAP